MTKDLTSGRPLRLLFSFTLPILFGLLFQQLYNLVDTMIVGKLLGARALAAVGATGSISFFVIGFTSGLCSGFAIPTAQQMGARDFSAMRRFTANAAYLAAGFALAVTLLTCRFCREILTLMRTPADIFEDSYAYIFIIFLGIPATMLYDLLACILRALGDSKTPVYFLALSSLLNIVLDTAFILFLHTGVAGAAVATVLSQASSGLACLVYIRRRFPILRMTKQERRLDGRCCAALCAMGIPMGLQYSITAVGSIILQWAVNALGSTYVAAVAAGSKLIQLLSCPYDAMGDAMATYCGENVGAGKLDRLGKGIRSSLLLGLLYAAAALAAMLLFSSRGAMLFLDAQELQLPLLLALTQRYILVQTAFFCSLTTLNILRFSMQGMGFGVLAMTAGVLEMAARTVIGFLVVPCLGYDAVCLASPAAWTCADLFLLPACVCCIRHLKRRACAAASPCA